MLASEMIQEVKDHGFDGIADASILEFINDAYFIFCAKEPWPFLEKSSALTTDGAGKVTTPTDIRSILILVDTTNGNTLFPKRLDTLTQLFSKELAKTGNAIWYYFIGDSLYLFPIPTGVAYTARYLLRPTALATTDAPIFDSNFHRLLVMGANKRCAVITDDIELADYWAKEEDRYEQDIRNVLWRKQYDEPDTIQDVDYLDYWDLY